MRHIKKCGKTTKCKQILNNSLMNFIPNFLDILYNQITVLLCIAHLILILFFLTAFNTGKLLLFFALFNHYIFITLKFTNDMETLLLLVSIPICYAREGCSIIRRGGLIFIFYNFLLHFLDRSSMDGNELRSHPSRKGDLFRIASKFVTLLLLLLLSFKL